MAQKEAKARIKINKLLEEAGWRILEDKNGKPNVLLEVETKLKSVSEFDHGEDFEKTKTATKTQGL
ncbi:hypothetical protein JXI42_03405 [bacterium]|nr:hypothetical protein [bacterium]